MNFFDCQVQETNLYIFVGSGSVVCTLSFTRWENSNDAKEIGRHHLEFGNVRDQSTAKINLSTVVRDNFLLKKISFLPCHTKQRDNPSNVTIHQPYKFMLRTKNALP